MGIDIRFNWALQITPPKDLKERETYSFEKPGNRIFPLETPIDLITMDREAIAKIEVTEFTNRPGTTTGTYQVIKKYSGSERKASTRYWKENI
ncbi:DUF2584 family protein [Candidatus Pacearchaeota archaeon]|nr:DUF2584 family protein [Candidatus Pacearchaeota archaeon]